ncbi:MAG: hypothetical protein V5A64_01980 [Candidatus Thermoplasmatota archaeon]
MKKRIFNTGFFFAVATTFILTASVLIPIASATDDTSDYNGFDKGPSSSPVAPLKKTTFIEYDEDSYLDDYSYLASLPTAVFKDKETLYSHPLLFYQEEQNFEGKKTTLNDRRGLDYFMEDWMGYCNGQMDEVMTVNVPENKVDQWNAKEYNVIEGDNPYSIASDLALQDWSYSDDAVVSVVNEDFVEKHDKKTQNKIDGTLNPCEVKKENTLSLKQTNSLNPVFQTFTVEKDYVYLEADCWWDGVLVANKMVPAGDPDLQLYCKHDGNWMQTVVSTDWNIYRPAGHELAQAYVYNPGEWRVGVTDFPTEGDAPRKGVENVFEIQGSLPGMIKNMVKDVEYKVDITKYPGVHVDVPDMPSFGTRDAYFNLTWDNPGVNLGFTLVGPSGEAIYTANEDNEENEQSMHINHLGECLQGEEGYKISVFSTDDVENSVDFEIEYSWRQNITKEKSDSLTSATEGAVLASQLNTPLLYIKKDEIPETTKNALYKLGVKNIHLVDLNSRLKNDVKNQLQEVGEVKLYEDYRYIYDKIRDLSGESQDVVFSTLDPWTKWYKEELKPGDETHAGLFIGPAAFSAAHHGTPVVFVDNHPRLSQAATWHNDYWRKHADERYDFKPSMAEMVLTGRQIYDFLKDYGFDQEGKESIITVADQYEIGIPWDRIFIGVAHSGRICGSPIDTATWISRSMFYPGLVFQNPAMQGSVELINGSVSSQDVGLSFGGDALIDIDLGTFEIERQTGVEEYKYPALCSFVTHKYRFNERASKYYGSKYQCADGMTPGETNTMNPIDQGIMEKYTGKEGSVFPDMTESEFVPFYLRRGGYECAFSTELESVVENLNKGVLLWVHSSHGSEPNGGQTLFWDPDVGFSSHGGMAKLIDNIKKLSSIPLVGNMLFGGFVLPGALKEENPWRGYDWQMGSTKEPDTMSMDIKGFFPFTNIRLPIPLAMGLTWVLARKPLREFLNTIIPAVDPFNVDNLYDGVTGAIGQSKYPLANKNATQLEENLENLHSLGFITSICQTSNTYLHMMMIRHGSVFQVQDPWPTSWYGGIWRQSIPRDIILGDTVGEAYSKGISHVGPLYLSGQWWWDDAENVVFFGDPDLRMYVPNTEYSDNNHWTQQDVKPISYDSELNIDGHMPFGATNHPHERKPKSWLDQYLPILVILVVIILIILGMVLTKNKERKRGGDR